MVRCPYINSVNEEGKEKGKKEGEGKDVNGRNWIERGGASRSGRGQEKAIGHMHCECRCGDNGPLYMLSNELRKGMGWPGPLFSTGCT